MLAHRPDTGVQQNASAAAETDSAYVDFEKRAAAIYLGVARRFRDNSELSWFWLGMSMAEQQHALILAFCEGQNLLRNGPSEESQETRDLRERFNLLESLAAQKDLSIDGAFLIAAELETSEINAIYERFVRPVQGTSYFTRKKIETLGVNHPAILMNAAKKFGVSRQVFEKLTQLVASHGSRLKGAD
jgi:hypothetical protein